MPDPKFPKIPSNLDAIFKAASQLKKIDGLVPPQIPPGDLPPKKWTGLSCF